jgi:hypothetical protein
MFTATPDPIEVVWTMGHWSILHCSQVLASYEAEGDARRTALAIERLRPKERADLVAIERGTERVASGPSFTA